MTIIKPKAWYLQVFTFMLAKAKQKTRYNWRRRQAPTAPSLFSPFCHYIIDNLNTRLQRQKKSFISNPIYLL